MRNVNAETNKSNIGSGKRGLTALLIAQFMGAANDNILKMLLSFAVVNGIWQGKLGQGGQGLIALCLFVPFILFSGWAGPLADRHSKRTIAILMKWCELPLAIAAGVGFVTGNFWLTAITMILLATQSTIFSPAKYGMIPELVPERAISRANGILNMTTNIAVITGMIAAGIVSEYFQQGELLEQSASQNPSLIALVKIWLPGIVLVGVAIIGIVAIFWLPKLKALDPKIHIPINPMSSYISTGKEMWKSQLFRCAIAWALFYLLATVALLVVTELGKPLQASDVTVSYLLASIGVAVGIGSLTAGLISKKGVRIKLSRVGSIGLFVSLLVVGVLPVSFWLVLVCLVCLGFFAGLYAVPLQSLMQLLALPERRGRVLATSNAISFLFMAMGSLAYWACRPIFGNSPQYIFILCSGVALIAWIICRRITTPDVVE